MNYPCETQWPGRGDVFVRGHDKCVIVQGQWVGDYDIDRKWRYDYRILIDDKDRPEYGLIDFNFLHDGQKLTIIGKMVQKRLSSNEPFVWQDSVPDENAALRHPLDHSRVLPEEHPLRNMPYWGATKPLTILDCLQWALIHLQHCDEELPCQENEEALTAIGTAINRLQERKRRRQEQGVLGTNKSHMSVNPE